MNKHITKADLIQKLHTNEPDFLSKAASQRALECIINEIVEQVSKGNEVHLSGFGTFKPVKRASRNGRNPRTGEVLHIPEKTVPVFKAGKVFKKKFR